MQDIYKNGLETPPREKNNHYLIIITYNTTNTMLIWLIYTYINIYILYLYLFIVNNEKLGRLAYDKYLRALQSTT